MKSYGQGQAGGILLPNLRKALSVVRCYFEHRKLWKCLKKTITILCIVLSQAIYATAQIVEGVNDFDSLFLSKECNLNKEQLGKIFTKVEISAAFPGGFNKWFDFANSNFDFENVIHQLGDTVNNFEDSIIVRFIVERNGTLCGFKFQAGNPILVQPTLRLLRLSPPWIPGIYGGRLLNSYRILRIDVIINRKQSIKTIKHYTNSYFRE